MTDLRTLGRAEMDRAVNLFILAMRHELSKNTHKPGWENAGAEVMAESLVYHVSKLLVALTLGNVRAVREYAPDVANEAMMVADCVGVLEMPPAPTPVVIGEVVFDVAGAPENGKSDGGVAAERLEALAKEFIDRVALIATVTGVELELTEGQVG